MAERLTEKTSFGYVRKGYVDYGNTIKETKLHEVIDKLGKLEDIMERLGINFVEDLEDEVRSLRVDKYIYKKDRDTWKRACELASSHISWCPAKQSECNCTEEKRDCTNYFYQQAKKEGNDE